MPDLLVKLYDLPDLRSELTTVASRGLLIRRANPWELSATRAFIEKHFTVGWADEAAVGFAHQPITTYLAIRNGTIVGFASYEGTRRGFFGPTGVAESERGQGAGRALLLACLHGLADLGYAYGIIGGAGPVEFYEKACGATVIEGSVPGIYRDFLKKPST
ncbi:MAG TPA: GNAT family N-acetyltransferase [Tepidisphaeraceae bacterium]|nr:GNAT family N-acetyltransferase [Tepidisphaeraceae bacterium]